MCTRASVAELLRSAVGPSAWPVRRIVVLLAWLGSVAVHVMFCAGVVVVLRLLQAGSFCAIQGSSECFRRARCRR
eukprot:4293363-Prorocentrum_lima.AAC.1